MHAKHPCSADGVANSLFSCGVPDWGMGSGHASAGRHPKRRFDRSGGMCTVPEWDPQARQLKSTADVMARAGITEAQVDACNVRCGIGGLKPVREAVHNMFRGKVVRFCRIVPAFILRMCLERAIEFADDLFLGFTSSALLHWSRVL